MSDQLLWNQLREGNHQALEAIYRQHFSYLFNYGKRIAKDVNSIEDCLQDLFVELWHKRSQLSQTDAIRPYLIVSMRRKLIKVLSKSAKNISDIELTELSFGAEIAIDQIWVDQEIAQEKKINLAKAFKHLSDRQKEILYLKYYSEMDYETISEAMNLNYQSARNLVSRALQKLAQHMTLLLLVLFSI